MAASKSVSGKSAAKKAAKKRKPPAALSATTEIDARIAVVRNNLRELVEQAASRSGASDEELMSERISAQEAKLEFLKKQRDELSRKRRT